MRVGEGVCLAGWTWLFRGPVPFPVFACRRQVGKWEVAPCNCDRSAPGLFESEWPLRLASIIFLHAVASGSRAAGADRGTLERPAVAEVQGSCRYRGTTGAGRSIVGAAPPVPTK